MVLLTQDRPFLAVPHMPHICTVSGATEFTDEDVQAALEVETLFGAMERQSQE